MNSENINWHALVNYISGQSSPAEEEVIRDWIALDPKNEEFIIFLKKIWDSSAEEKQKWDADSAWARFNAEYDLPFSDDNAAGKTGRNLPVRRNRKQHSWYSWAAVAASVILIFTALYSFDIIKRYGDTASAEEEVQYREIVTKNGQRTHLNLSDGSSVILNAGSRLVLPETFGDQGPRELTLSGEAYFDVAHNPEQPFIVYTEDAVTRVLGTKFQVRSYPEDEEVEVVVAEGKVALRGQDETDQTGAQITKNQIGVWPGSGTASVSGIDDLAPYLGWTEGNLVFEREPLENVVAKLRRWYDVDVKIEGTGPVQNKKELTASFSENQPVAEVFEAITLTLDIEYRKEGRTFTFIL